VHHDHATATMRLPVLLRPKRLPVSWCVDSSHVSELRTLNLC